MRVAAYRPFRGRVKGRCRHARAMLKSSAASRFPCQFEDGWPNRANYLGANSVSSNNFEQNGLIDPVFTTAAPLDSAFGWTACSIRRFSSDMRLLITGAAGYIGTNLSLAAMERGIQIVGLDNLAPYYSPEIKRSNRDILKQRGCGFVEADLADGAWRSALEGVDAIVHLAGQPGISANTVWEDYERNNLIATHRLAEAATECPGLKAFVNISSSSVYGLHAMDRESAAPKPASWYGATKLAAEQEVMAAQRGRGLPACSLRLFSVYGERERPEKLCSKLIRAIDQDLEFPVFEGSLEHQRSFTYVGDICEGILGAGEMGSR